MPARKAPMENLPRPDSSVGEIIKEMLEDSSSSTPLNIMYKGRSFDLYYKKLNWLAKSRCVSAATEYGASGEKDMNGNPIIKGIFRLDVYKKEVLKEILANPPFPLTDNLLERIPDEIGSQLEGIIPDPFTASSTPDSGK